MISFSLSRYPRRAYSHRFGHVGLYATRLLASLIKMMRPTDPGMGTDMSWSIVGVPRKSRLGAMLLVVMLLAGSCRGGASTGDDVSIPEFTPTPAAIECLNDRYPEDAPQLDDGSSVDYETKPSGLGLGIAESGDGESAAEGSTVSLQYTGWLEDGCVFDSSHIRGGPSDFQLQEATLIPGMLEGLTGMQVSGERWLRIPPELAYGARGVPGVIPGDATLIFRVELVDVKPQAADSEGEAQGTPEAPIIQPEANPSGGSDEGGSP